MKFHEVNIEDCKPYPCTPLYSCTVHAVSSVELKESGWPEPSGGWEAYDQRVETAKAQLLSA